MFSKIFQLTGLTCPACQKVCAMVIGDIPGVTGVRVDLAKQTALVEAENEIYPGQIRDALKLTHYKLVE